MRKRLFWMGDSRKRLAEFPEEVRSEIGYALFLAEWGEYHPSAKRMQRFNAIEVVADYDGDAFRGVYTTRFKDSVYVLHCFQKKSKKGSETPRTDLGLIEKRLKEAEEHYKASQQL